jgi:hypothetical protein
MVGLVSANVVSYKVVQGHVLPFVAAAWVCLQMFRLGAVANQYPDYQQIQSNFDGTYTHTRVVGTQAPLTLNHT